jgi:Domain of unknown function (DUF4167)
LINNRQGGRRRGRGGQRPQGIPGRGDGNRQDNRQRGNAAQLLEKYKSMARDAQLAGDRVQTEYYLQFADHYFRVLGESRVRFEEQRRLRGDDAEGDDDEGEGEEMAEAEGAEAEADDRPQRRPRRDRDRDDRFDRQERPERSERSNGRARDERPESEEGERIPFDALPPAIRAEDSEEAAEEEAPRPRRRARRPRAEDGEADIAPAA